VARLLVTDLVSEVGASLLNVLQSLGKCAFDCCGHGLVISIIHMLSYEPRMAAGERMEFS
jgi:hypothetical protein